MLKAEFEISNMDGRESFQEVRLGLFIDIQETETHIYYQVHFGFPKIFEKHNAYTKC